MTTQPLKIAVLISGGGTTLLNIQQQIDQDNLPAQIVAVVCSNDKAKGVERAKSIGLDPVVINPKKFDDRDEFTHEVWTHIRQAKAELVIMAGYLILLPIPTDFQGKVMNIHPALLPAFGGKGMYGHHVHDAVLASGCKVSGCTVHFADNRYDKGPIIIQQTCNVHEDDTPDTLAARIFQEECTAYPKAIKLYAQGQLKIDGQVVRITN